MEFGICCGPEGAAVAAEAGYAYIEWTVGGLLRPAEDDGAFGDALAAARAAPLPCPVVNCFLPGEHRVVGPAVDADALCAYVATAFARARAAGVSCIVFGSGGARAVPDGFDRDEARHQVVAFCRMLGPTAAEHGVTVALEHLSGSPGDPLPTLDAAADVVREVDHPAFRLLVDSFHWGREKDSLDAIRRNGALLAHVHVATVANRRAPGAEPCVLESFFAALKEAGYDGRVSFEGGNPDPATDLPRALSLMREWTA
jgi:sugar phosphate isomerase/epimerase